MFLVPFAFLAVFALIALLILSVVSRRTASYFGMPAGDAIRLPVNMGWILLVAAAVLNIFAYDVGFGIGYGVFGATMIGCTLWSFPQAKRGTAAWFLAITGIVACLLFGFRANEFVQGVNVVTALVCLKALILLRSVDSFKWSGLWILKMKLGFLAKLLQHPFSIGAAMKPQSAGNKVIRVLLTLAITAIVLIFFSAILSSADPVFDTIVSSVRDQVFGRAVLSGILAVILVFGLSVLVPAKWQEHIPRMKILGFMETFVPALSLVLLFGLFLGVQARYLFASQDVFQAMDITYADYVRRGFMELLVASFFASLISYVLFLKSQALQDAAQALKLKWVNGVLLAELLLLLASAARRDWMYIDTYGLSRVRFIGAIFLFWLACIILLLIALTLIRTVTEKHLIGGAAILSAVVVLTLNGLNIDRIVALTSPPAGERPDIVYMSRLSADAAEGWSAAVSEAFIRYEPLRAAKQLTGEQKSSLADAKIAMAVLNRQIDETLRSRPWQEWNLSRRHAASAIGSSPDFFGPMATCILNGITDIQRNAQADLEPLIRERVSEYHSPFIFNSIYDFMDYDDIAMPAGSPSDVPAPSCDLAAPFPA